MTAGLVVIPAGHARSNHGAVARTIGLEIVAGRLASGAKLPGDADLMDRFGVSRPVLRESVKTLVAKGLLTTRAKVGTVVRDRSAWNMFDPDVVAWHLEVGVDGRFLRDLADIRLAVEPQAAALAAARRTDSELAIMRAAVERMGREAPDSAGFVDADLALHLGVANASGNPFMRSIGAVIEAALRASLLLSAPVDVAEREAAIGTHARIVDAIERRDTAQAAASMAAVIQNGLRRHGAASA